MRVILSPLMNSEWLALGVREASFFRSSLKSAAACGLSFALAGCAMFDKKVDVAAEETPAVEERDTRIASLETELEAAKAQNAELSKKLAALQQTAKLAAEPTNLSPPELKEGASASATATQSPTIAPDIKADAVVAAADAGRALASAPSKPVESSPRLVQPSFASDDEIFENEAGDGIKTSSVLYGVHLASYRHEVEARAGWSKLQHDFPDELGLLEPRLEKVEIEGRGEFLRLVGGGFASQDKAAALCAKLRAKSAYCAVASFAGEKLSRPETALR